MSESHPFLRHSRFFFSRIPHEPTLKSIERRRTIEGVAPPTVINVSASPEQGGKVGFALSACLSLVSSESRLNRPSFRSLRSSRTAISCRRKSTHRLARSSPISGICPST